jgi:outer membrane receptor for ferrienterochelin and colicins
LTHKLYTAICLLHCVVGNQIAKAQDVTVIDSQQGLKPREENGRLTYDAIQFDRFAPQTAADMARQVPGFTISQTSSDRGLGEASQNVLINGARIASKNDDAQATLGRISAKSVLKLEIIDGATLNIPGLSGQVLNVITKPASMTGNFNWGPRFRSRLDPQILTGAINLSGKLGKGEFTVGLNADNSFVGGGWGEEISLDANQHPLFTRDFTSQSKGDRPRLTASYGAKSAKGTAFNINGALEIFRFRNRTDQLRKTPGGNDLSEISTNREAEWNYELGSDYEFPVGSGKLKLIGYQRFEHSPVQSSFVQTDVGGPIISGSRFNRTADEGETVLRGEYRIKSGKNDFGISLEGARNFLDAESEFLIRDTAGIYQSIPLPGATSRVEEKRSQIILSYGRPLSSSLSLQATLGGEYSQISQSGAGGLTRNFLRPKASINLGWKASTKLDASFRLQRKVGQLNFSDFLSSVDLQNNNNNGANHELVPPQSWIGELELNRSLGKTGSIKIGFVGEHISDIVDQIPIGPNEEAPGNLPSADIISASLNATLLLDSIGFHGAKLDIDGKLQRSWLADPITGITRPINQDTRYSYSIGIRHDIPHSKLAWGMTLEAQRNAPFYRLDYFYDQWNDKGFARIYVEHKDVLGMKLRAVWGNFLGQTEKTSETFYIGRRDGPIERYSSSVALYKNIFRIHLSGTF